MFFLEGSFYSFFYIFNRKAEIWEKLLFLNWSSPQVVHISYIVHNHDFLYHLGAILKKKKKLFSNFSFLVEDTEKWIKHHFFVYKKSISDQNFKGISQKIGLPHPWEVQNWNGRGRHSFSATNSKFWGNSYFLKIFKW